MVDFGLVFRKEKRGSHGVEAAIMALSICTYTRSFTWTPVTQLKVILRLQTST